jgi:hypothetical protein
VALQNLGSDPGTPATGQIYFNTGGTVKVYNGSTWLSLSTTSGTVTSVTGTSPVVSSGGTTPAISLASGYGDTLNPYASKSANTILAAPSGSGGTPSFRSLAAADIPSTLNATTFGGAVAMGTNRITGLGEPSAGTDAATKNYVDSVAQGVNAHDAVRTIFTTTIAGTYAGGTTTTNPPGDGGNGFNATITFTANGATVNDTSVTLAQYDRVLVTNGTTALSGSSSIANGIYVVTTAGSTGVATVLTRALDYDNTTFGDIAAGDLIYISAGTAYAGTQWIQTNKGTATTGTGSSTKYCVLIGTDAITFTQFSGASSTTAGAGLAQNGNAFDVGAGTGITVNSNDVAINTAVVPRLTSANAFTVGGHTITNDAVGTVPLAITGIASQTANSFIIQSSTSALRHRFTDSGRMYSSFSGTFGSTTDNSGTLSVIPTASSIIGQVIKGVLSQTANLQEWQTYDTSVVAKVDPTGIITALKYVTTSGTSSQFVKGDGSLDSSTYLTSAGAVTSVNGSTGAITGVAKKTASTVVLTANTQATINHALGTQAVIVQMFDSSWNLVDMDVLNFDANNVKVTSQTAGTYNYVIIG